MTPLKARAGREQVLIGELANITFLYVPYISMQLSAHNKSQAFKNDILKLNLNLNLNHKYQRGKYLVNITFVCYLIP